MPMIRLPIPETTETVTRPVMLDIMRQVMRLSGISNQTPINYFGDIEKGKQLGSAIDVSGDDPNSFAFNEKVTIEVTENFNLERVPGEQIFGPENFLLFNDPALDIIIKPFYAQIEASITVKYRAVSENQAIQWRNMMKARISQGANVNMHQATYSYGLPDEAMYVLKELHRLRENVAGYDEDFETYFANHRAPQMTQLANVSGTATMWVMPETQNRVMGWFDWELPEKGEKDGDGETRTISFTYRFNYARPDGLAMVYPIIVHNQLIDEKFRDIALDDYHDNQQAMPHHTRTLESFAGAKQSPWERQQLGYSIPTFDEFMPKSTPIKSRRLVTVLFTIDDTDPHAFMNLGELGQKQFTPEILEYMRSEQSYLTKPFLSALNVSLYKNGNWVDPFAVPITVDNNLNVRGTVVPNLRDQHHIRIGLLTDLSMLRGDAIQRLQDHGRAAIQILLEIDPSLQERGLLPALIGDNFISKTGLLIAIGALRPNNIVYAQRPNFPHVQSLIIEASRERI